MRANAWHTVAGACALLLVALGITGCGPRPPEAELKAGAGRLFGVSFQTMNNPFFVELNDGIRGVVEAHGDRLVTLDAQWNSLKQKNDVSDLILQGATAVFLNPVNWEGVKGSLLQAREKGIPVVAGTIWIDGRRAAITSVAAATRAGIRIIHQELSLAPNLSVAENIYLGREPARFGLLSRRRMCADAAALLRRLELGEIGDVTAPVARLSVARRQLVEIARALCEDCRILVLDEPTSALSEAETEHLFTALRRLRAEGVGIIYISHRLDEIARLTDRITVYRDGHRVGTQATAQMDRAELVRWMVGREIAEHFPRAAAARQGPVVLEVGELRNRRVRGVSFRVHAGEVVGIAGLMGAGRSEMARALFGIDPIDSGAIRVAGRAVRIRRPQDALAAGLVLVPEDRQEEGLCRGHSVAFNLVLPWVRDWVGLGRVDGRRRRAIVERAVQLFGIRLGDPEEPVETLSGGNQQKVLLARWMERRPAVLILDEPTRGVDVGAREEIFRVLADLVADGMAVLLISSDLSEVLGVAHRVLVYRGGRILRELGAGDATAEGLMHMLTETEGARGEAA